MSSFWFDPMVNTVGMPNNPGPTGNNFAAVQAMNNAGAANRAYVGGQNQAALAAAAPMPPGYGQVHLPYLSGSFGSPAARGTFSPGSGRSSFSGIPLGGNNWIGGAWPTAGKVQSSPLAPLSTQSPLPQMQPFQPDMSSSPRSPFTGMGFGGNRDFLASILRQSASPQAPDLRLGFGKADRSPLFTGDGAGARGITDFGGQSRNPYASFADRFGEMASPARSGGIGSDMLRGDQNNLYAQPWHSLIPTNRGLNTPEIIKQINYTAGRGRYDPAALAGVINTESGWNPRTNTGSYFGATQMGADTFKDFGRLSGMNFGEYKQAPLEQQIPAYGDWLANYARAPNSAGRLATSDIRGQSVPMQAAILQGTQFSPYGGLPNTPQWPQAFARGDTTSVSPSPIDPRTGLPARQADFLSPGGRGSIPPTINSMQDYYARLFGGLR